jgi:hypothetical protein
MELLENREKTDSAEQIANIDRDLGKQIERLEKLCAATSPDASIHAQSLLG